MPPNFIMEMCLLLTSLGSCRPHQQPLQHDLLGDGAEGGDEQCGCREGVAGMTQQSTAAAEKEDTR